MKLLTFRLARDRYALALEEVGEVVPPGPIRTVPGAPPAVRGLAERRGRIVVVLDLPRLLDDEPPAEPETFFLRLAAPRDGTALWVPARVAARHGETTPPGHAPQGIRGGVVVDGVPHLLVDLEVLLRRAAA